MVAKYRGVLRVALRHVCILRRYGLICVGLAWLAWVTGQEALAAIPMRAVILFDTSGSMRQNDPQRLSHVAAQLFLELARPRDQMGLVAFSDRGVPLVPLTSLSSPEARRPFAAALRSLPFNGQTTDLGVALRMGLASFPEQKAAPSRDLVLLLTDGKLDLGAQRRGAEPLALAYIQDTLLPEYQERGIALYTIAFTEGADRALLQELAQATAGEFRFIPNASMLHHAFSALFVMAKEAESIPMQNGAVLMDASIQEASLVLAKPNPQEPLGLVTPQQQRLDAGSKHPGVRWNATPAYDMVQRHQPESGKWQVERPSGGGDDMAIIGASTLSLHIRLSPEYLEAGEPLRMQVHLLDQQQPIRDPQRLQELQVHAEIIAPMGESQRLPLTLQQDGEFAATLNTHEIPGQYGLVLSVSGPTLQRQRTLSFMLQPRCFVPAVLAEPAVTVRVTLTDACPFFRTLQLEASYGSHALEEAGANRWVPLESLQPRVFEAVLPPPGSNEKQEVRLRIHGSLNHQAFTLIKGPLSLPELPAPPLDWLALAQTVGLQLCVVNIVLAAFGTGGYGLYRYRTCNRRVSDA
jgi:von Willebrand factor type A domain